MDVNRGLREDFCVGSDTDADGSAGRGVRGASRLNSVVLALAVVALAGFPAGRAEARELRDVVARHIEWQKSVTNYRAEITRLGLVSDRVGTVFVDNTTDPPTIHFEGTVEIAKRERPITIVGTKEATKASVGSRVSQWELSEAPFGNSFSIISSDAGVDESVERIEATASDVEVLENPVGGLVGIRMNLDNGFMSKVDAMLESILLGGSIDRGLEATIWFNEDGRIERTVINEGQSDMVINRFKYLEVNVAESRAAELRKTVETAKRAKVYPSLLEMVWAIVLDERADTGVR
jgi:hypothetical protein